MSQNSLAYVNQMAAKYLQMAKSGNLWIGTNETLVTLSAGLNLTYVGLCLSNPPNSGKNFGLIRVAGQTQVAPAALLGCSLITGWAPGGITAHTTPGTPFNAIINGGNSPVSHLDTACTLVGSPGWQMPLGMSLATADTLQFDVAFDGMTIITPGGYVAIGATIAGPANGFQGSIVWQEGV
jgi:hypothetical protein